MKRSRMTSGGGRVRGLVALLGLATCGVVTAAEPVYRWTDSRGQVNYGNQPPPGVRAEALGDKGALSVLPAPPVVPRPAVHAELPPASPVSAPAPEPAAADEHKRIECEERLRVPCDDSGHALRPALVVVPQRPRHPPALSPPPRSPRNADMPQPVLPLDLSGRDERPAPRNEPERRGRAFPPP